MWYTLKLFQSHNVLFWKIDFADYCAIRTVLASALGFEDSTPEIWKFWHTVVSNVDDNKILTYLPIKLKCYTVVNVW